MKTKRNTGYPSAADGPPYVHWTAFPPGFIEPYYPLYRVDGYYAQENPVNKTIPCPACGKLFATQSGLAWHHENKACSALPKEQRKKKKGSQSAPKSAPSVNDFEGVDVRDFSAPVLEFRVSASEPKKEYIEFGVDPKDVKEVIKQVGGKKPARPMKAAKPSRSDEDAEVEAMWAQLGYMNPKHGLKASHLKATERLTETERDLKRQVDATLARAAGDRLPRVKPQAGGTKRYSRGSAKKNSSNRQNPKGRLTHRGIQTQMRVLRKRFGAIDKDWGKTISKVKYKKRKGGKSKSRNYVDKW